MSPTSRLSNGRTVIPAVLRAQLDIQDAVQLIWSVNDGALVAITRRAQLRQIQALVRRYVPEGVSLADELIVERRAKNAKDEAN